MKSHSSHVGDTVISIKEIIKIDPSMYCLYNSAILCLCAYVHPKMPTLILRNMSLLSHPIAVIYLYWDMLCEASLPPFHHIQCSRHNYTIQWKMYFSLHLSMNVWINKKFYTICLQILCLICRTLLIIYLLPRRS